MSPAATAPIVLAGALFLLAAPPPDPPAPTCRWVPAMWYTKQAEGEREVRYIVIHTIEGSLRSATSWFRSRESRVSAHYCVGHDGSIVQCVRERDIAWHAGNWEMNVHSIGIEHEGYAQQDTWTDAQIRASAGLARSLCERYGIPPDREHILSHAEITPERRTDPGPYFPWDRYLALVRGEPDPGAPPESSGGR